jgi:hypothetical protein
MRTEISYVYIIRNEIVNNGMINSRFVYIKDRFEQN